MDIENEEERRGGPQNDEETRKREERERKKAEVRKRLEESGKKKSKKGFLTPERKKKLRKLLMLKAAEDLKQQQLKKDQERQKTLASRIIKIPDIDKIDNQGELEKIAKDLIAKFMEIADSKYDLEFNVTQKDHQVSRLALSYNTCGRLPGFDAPAAITSLDLFV